MQIFSHLVSIFAYRLNISYTYLMQKIKLIFIMLLASLIICGFKNKEAGIDISAFSDYQKEYVGEEIGVCSISSVKTYESYKAITSTSSKQYQFIKEHMHVDPSGLLVDKDGFFGVALGSYYGVIGDRFYFTLDSGIVLPVVKIDEKADKDVINGCAHDSDGSVIELVIDTELASSYFGRWGNNLVLSGNFNNNKYFNGHIEKVEKVTAEKNENYVTFKAVEDLGFDNSDIFNYDSSY